MSTVFSGRRYYRTKEVCELTGVSRFTLLRWIKTGVVEDTANKDRRGWRLFTDEDITLIQKEAQRVK